jgi:hypothetical protein
MRVARLARSTSQTRVCKGWQHVGFYSYVDSDFISMIAAVFSFGQISTHSPQRVLCRLGDRTEVRYFGAAIAVFSRAARTPCASFSASSLAQKWIKNMRG